MGIYTERIDTEVLGGTGSYVTNAYIKYLGTSSNRVTNAFINTLDVNGTTTLSSDLEVKKGHIKAKTFETWTGSNYYALTPPEEREGSELYYLGTNSRRWDQYVVATSDTKMAYYEADAGDSSDIRLKNSIIHLPDVYSTLFDKLSPVIYKYNDGESNRFHTGFIAQEVEKAVLESGLTTQDFAAVVHRQETGPEGEEIDQYYLRYGEFVALNTNEIQKLKKRVAELEAQLARLTATT